MTVTRNNAISRNTGNGNLPSKSGQLESLLNSAQGQLPASGRELLMIEFLRSSCEMTRKLIESQERVMLVYLGAASSSKPMGSLAKAEIAGQPNEIFSPQSLQPGKTTQVQIDLGPVFEQISSNANLLVPAYEYAIESRPAVQTIQAPHPAEQATGQLVRTPSPAGAKPAELDSDGLIAELINIVSERTGYPAEMLDPTLDLEADLGIDSIKRVEILNSFRRLLPEDKQVSLEDGIEKLASVKSLQGIMDWIRNDLPLLGQGGNKADAEAADDKQAVLAARST